MESTHPTNVDHIVPPDPQEQLSELFGSYKAEWLREQLFELFTEPSYFPELKTPRPCVLVGGRGTGKTTVLRCLSYEGQYALSGHDPKLVPTWAHYGFYFRVNTNRVTAFKGPELHEEEWVKVFAHYFNLDVCDGVLRFLQWYKLRCDGEDLSPTDCSEVAHSLHLDGVTSVKELASQVTLARIKFEAYVNNVKDDPRPPLSLQGAPLDLLMRKLSGLSQFREKSFFILIDEYENFEDYQQQVLNTLIKHSGELYTFKVGVKDLGWRRRTTLNANEQLISPADYVRIDITDKLEDRFPDFAAAVCNARLRQLKVTQDVQSVTELFPPLSEDEEGTLLGVDALVKSIRDGLETKVTPAQLTVLRDMTPLQVYFLDYWAEAHKTAIMDELQHAVESEASWNVRFDNYKHAILFTIRKKKRGIRKFYAGWRTLVQLAAGNIRYLLELVDQCLLLHMKNGNTLFQPVESKTQTIAAQAVGRKNLTELEGLSVHGAKLTKLLLGLGRVFQVLAANPGAHAPEVTQFHLKQAAPPSPLQPEIEALIQAAVMHLAIVRFQGSKLQDRADTKDYDYMVHPIFAPLFEFSYRKKRKLMLSLHDIAGLVSSPSAAIAQILNEQGRPTDEPIPDQLALFEGFYAGDT